MCLLKHLIQLQSVGFVILLEGWRVAFWAVSRLDSLDDAIMNLIAEFKKRRASKNFHLNSPIPFLMSQTIRQGLGVLGPHGELVVETGAHTGRSANDKYVVKSSQTEAAIWWENNVNEMSESAFQLLKNDVLDYLLEREDIYAGQSSIGHSQFLSFGIETISETPSAIHFTKYMFKRAENHTDEETFGILHAPFFKLDPVKYGVKTGTVIVTCFTEKLTIIVGTLYAGEIKKSMFSVMNFLAPDRKILPMHSGASQNKVGESFVFFGLSGTGKTTLSTDEGVKLIGDDEHGLSEQGIFNFEGGCYAKTHRLSAQTEPAIFSASTRFGSFLENVSYCATTNVLDFDDGTRTENGRASYPLEFIEERVREGAGPLPKALFFLSADAFGVLPALARLSAEQAAQYFILGYTAKLAGTEVGVKSPKAAFSPCFGAPFMLRHPRVYAELLSEFICKHKIQVYLVNTGWTGGEYGVGQRFPLQLTRRLIRAVQNGELDDVNFVRDEIFGLEIPQAIPGVVGSALRPWESWKNQADYQQKAKNLQNSFEEQLKKFYSAG